MNPMYHTRYVPADTGGGRWRRHDDTLLSVDANDRVAIVVIIAAVPQREGLAAVAAREQSGSNKPDR